MIGFEQLDRLRRMTKRAGLGVGKPPGGEQAARDAAREVYVELYKRPIIQHFLKHLARHKEPRNTQPWQALAEQLMGAALCCLAIEPKAKGVVSIDGLRDPRMGKAENAMVAATRFLSAQPYLWTTRIYDLVQNAPMPRHVISRELLPYPRTYWSFETSVDMADGRTGEIKGHSDFMLLADEGEGLSVTFNVAHDNQQAFEMFTVPYGKTFPDDFDHPTTQAGVAFILKGLAFLASPFTETPKRRMPGWVTDVRPGQQEANDQEIHVVVLRRAAADAIAAEAGGTREYHSQWWVSGHYRPQWYPSTESHKVIWIAPYLKGPTDGPLITKVYAVQR